VTSAQIRAGRALVNWTVRKLAEKAGIHRNTVTNIETERSSADDATLDAIRRALEKAGVEFTNGKRPGVRLRA
jgi:transcriptional regulator with XRE-family HTH domain